MRWVRVLQALGINSVPVLGVFLGGWSTATALLLYWFENLLATSASHLARERDLRNLGDELGDRAIRDDLELAIFDLDILLASSEVTGINDLGRASDDVAEAANACGDMRLRREVGDSHIPGA